MSVKLFGIKEDGTRQLRGIAPGWEPLMRYAVALNLELRGYQHAMVEDNAPRPEGLPIWTVYDHPVDWPGWYVARESINEHKTGNLVLYRDLQKLRDAMELRGLVPMMRAESDPAVILETWM